MIPPVVDNSQVLYCIRRVNTLVVHIYSNLYTCTKGKFKKKCYWFECLKDELALDMCQ